MIDNRSMHILFLLWEELHEADMEARQAARIYKIAVDNALELVRIKEVELRENVRQDQNLGDKESE